MFEDTHVNTNISTVTHFKNDMTTVMDYMWKHVQIDAATDSYFSKYLDAFQNFTLTVRLEKILKYIDEHPEIV